jgi:hypothetical protein
VDNLLIRRYLTGIRSRSGQSVTSAASLSAVRARPDNREVVRSRGSQGGSHCARRLPPRRPDPRGHVVTARTVQGMARARSGQASAWPLVSDRSAPQRYPGSSVTSRVRSPGTFTCARCPAATVMLDAGGADTYTQRAIPGPGPDLDSCTFRPVSNSVYHLRTRPTVVYQA